MDGPTHDRLSCDGEICPHGPDRMTGQVTQGPRQIAFNEMPQPQDRRPRTSQRSASPSSTQQHRNCTHDRQIVTDDRAPAIEWIEVLSPMFSCELVVRRNHPQIVPQAGLTKHESAEVVLVVGVSRYGKCPVAARPDETEDSVRCR